MKGLEEASYKVFEVVEKVMQEESVQSELDLKSYITLSS